MKKNKDGFVLGGGRQLKEDELLGGKKEYSYPYLYIV